MVTVLDDSLKQQSIKSDDFKVEWFSGTGAGGQNRNKVQNSCRLIHIPSGIVETAQTRSRENSYNEAMSRLLKRLDSAVQQSHSISLSNIRKTQMGSGMRGDKIRTYRFQDDVVTNHINDKKANLSKVMNGFFDMLWS